MEDRFLKRLRKKARKGLRGWPIATIAFYGPNLSQATKITVGIVPSENAEVEELRDWKVNRGDIRGDPGIAREILEFIEKHRVLSVAMTDAIIGCPHQEGMDYEGEWCPARFGTDEIALRGEGQLILCRSGDADLACSKTPIFGPAPPTNLVTEPVVIRHRSALTGNQS